MTRVLGKSAATGCKVLEPATRLRTLKRKRDELDAEIKLIERGVERAAYDACMAEQLAVINEARLHDGKPPLTMSRFLSGAEGEAA